MKRAEVLDKDRLLRLIEVSRGLVSDLDVDAVLERVLSTAQDLTGARYAALGVVDERHEQLERFLTRGDSGETEPLTGDPPLGRGVLHPSMANFLGVPILIRGEASGSLYLTGKQDGPFTGGDEHAVVVLAEWAAVAIDNARLHAREASRRGELERVVQALEASTAIARAIGGETDLERVLELIVKRGRALVQAGAMMMLLHDGNDLVVRAGAGETAGSALGRRVGLDRLSARVLRHSTPLRIDDVEDQLPFFAELGVKHAQAAMVVPLVYRARGVGVLVAFDRLVEGPAFSTRDEALVLGFAASAAIAVATAQSVERERLRQSLASAEEERRHWARELHDETLQGLCAVALSLSAAQGSGDGSKLDRTVTDAIGQIQYEIAALRALITDLRPAELDDLGIVPALQTLIEHCGSLHDFQIEFDADLDYGRTAARLVPEAETAIYRVVQEAITNAGKHSGASLVQVAIEESGGLIRVGITDDGRGFDSATETIGFGLIGMHERAKLAGGRLEIESGSTGTTVRFVLASAYRDPAPAARQAIA